jgi:hypothetical protein
MRARFDASDRARALRLAVRHRGKVFEIDGVAENHPAARNISLTTADGTLLLLEAGARW